MVRKEEQEKTGEDDGRMMPRACVCVEEVEEQVKRERKVKEEVNKIKVIKYG